MNTLRRSRHISILTWACLAIALTFPTRAQSLTYRYSKRNLATYIHPTQPSISSSSSSTSTLFSNFQGQRDVQQQQPKRRPFRDYETVTDTKLERPPIKPQNSHPKVVVLGATGKVGRRIISKLMALDTQMTIVAVCRSYDVACDVLYDELTALDNSSSSSYQKRGPRLQLVVTDLISKQDVAGYDPDLERKRRDKEDEEDLEFAVSASRFYKDDLQEYDYRSSGSSEIQSGRGVEKDHWVDPDFHLKEAMKNCTVVISAVGTVRPTIPFVDYILKPWRIFLSPGRWCRDERHPYYVNYLVMEKVLKYAEMEQKQRENEWDEYLKTKEEDNDDDDDDDNNSDSDSDEAIRSSKIFGETNELETKKRVEKIRIIRISDLCVSNPAWNLVTMITNIALSLVFRYQEKCEKLLEASSLVDSIVLRPGDLMDAERNATSTSLQVDISGSLPCYSPGYVSRDDVAELATAAALFKLESPPTKVRKAMTLDGTVIGQERKKQQQKQNNLTQRKKRQDAIQNSNDRKTKHWNIAVAWAGEQVLNGKKEDGHENAENCMKFIVKKQAKVAKRERRRNALRNATPMSKWFTKVMHQRLQRNENGKTKPYGAFVFLPMLVTVYPILFSMLYRMGSRIPIVKAISLWIFARLKPSIDILAVYLMRYLQMAIQKVGLNSAFSTRPTMSNTLIRYF